MGSQMKNDRKMIELINRIWANESEKQDNIFRKCIDTEEEDKINQIATYAICRFKEIVFEDKQSAEKHGVAHDEIFCIQTAVLDAIIKFAFNKMEKKDHDITSFNEFDYHRNVNTDSIG